MATNTTAIPTIARRPANSTGAFGGLRLAFSRWQEQARIRDELHQMTSRELADLGLTPSDIDEVARGTYRRGD